MTYLPTAIELGLLSPSLGFKLQGANPLDYTGFNLSHANVNGDGFDDLIISADGYSGNGDRSGGTYVIFGGDRVQGLMDLATFDEEQGFIIKGASLYDLSGRDSAGAGDINGDGFDDVIVAAYLRDGGGYNSGGAHVIYGKASGFGAYVDLSSPVPDGFYEIIGENTRDYAGQWVSTAGDVNGDGFDDMVVGAPLNDSGGVNAGAAYLLFGGSTMSTASVDLAALDPSVGIKIQGSAAGDLTGLCVTGGGDLNGDGIEDFVVGALYQDGASTDAGAAYVIFGQTAGFSPVLDLAALSPAQGYAIQGEGAGDNFGWSVAMAGDVNGDGIEDLIVGAPHQSAGGVDAGAAYVVFGTTEGRADINIAELLAGGEAFKLQGGARDWTGTAVSSAGDFNNDGFDDILVGAWFDSTTGSLAGASYLVFGAGDLGAKTIALETLSSGDGIAIYGEAALDYLGQAVSAAGDINGDGFDDIVVGSAANGAGGFRSGAAYVIYGTDDFGTDDSIIGGVRTVLAGGAGNDSYLLRNAGYQVFEDAGDGNDTVYAIGSFTLGAKSAVETITVYDRTTTNTLALAGNELAQRIIGNDGVNSLRSGGGADVLFGLGGDDSFVIESADAQVIEFAGGGRDTVYTTTSYTLGNDAAVEVLLAYNRAGDAAMSLIGNGYGQTIYGNAGVNFLHGGGGADVLYGLGGDDGFMVDGLDDQVIEFAGGGTDTVYATGSFVLGTGSAVETVTVYDRSTTNAIDLIGNELTQRIIGNDGTNSLRSGSAGADVLIGLGGDDSFVIESADAQVIEFAGGGTDTVYTSGSFALGNAEIETLTVYERDTTNALNLTGSDIANRVIGNDGANVLDGKGGADTLYGLGGNDTFAFSTALGAANVDEIVGFVSGSDRIQLSSAIFAGIAPGALAANAFVTGVAATDGGDHILYNQATGALFYDFDGTGSAEAVQFATLTPGAALVASDIIVV